MVKLIAYMMEKDKNPFSSFYGYNSTFPMIMQ